MSFLDAFKVSMVDIVEEAKRGNGEFADSLLDPLFDRLDEELQTRLDFTTIHSAIGDIHTHLAVISNANKREASKLFTQISNSDLREGLIEFRSSFLQFYPLGDYPYCCKCAFQQIESLVNFLIFKRNIIHKIVSNSSLKVRYESEMTRIFGKQTSLSPKKGGGYEIALFVRLWFVSDEYQVEFKRLNTKYTDIRSYARAHEYNYRKCYELRNHDSHGLSFSSDDAHQIEVDSFRKNAATYFQAPNNLIDFLTQLVISVQDE